MNSDETKRSQHKLLFLLRTYNDLDHIAPVIWKAARLGYETLFAFVSEDYSADYRIKEIERVGSKNINLTVIKFYFNRIRPNLILAIAKRVIDTILGAVEGRRFLIKHQVTCVVTEWGGPNGKGMAPLVLKPARRLGIPTVAIPHGYHTWLNEDFNEVVSASLETIGKIPQLENRNLFSAYVVQSENIKKYCERSGISNEIIRVLGSARFCREWFTINVGLCTQDNCQSDQDGKITVLFFLSHWTYNVDRAATISLIKKIAGQENLRLIIKGHTRGRHVGGLSAKEEDLLGNYPSVEYAENNDHSPTLVALSDIVIVYGSSICFEALLQGKPVCRPQYLSSNTTIFDQSGMVFGANTEQQVISFIRSFKVSISSPINDSDLDNFLGIHTENTNHGGNVLESYVELLVSKSK